MAGGQPCGGSNVGQGMRLLQTDPAQLHLLPDPNPCPDIPEPLQPPNNDPLSPCSSWLVLD